jgi:hypothetical protein
VAALKPHFSELRRLNPVAPPPSSSFRSGVSSPSSSLSYTASPEEHAHVKIVLHLIESEVVGWINYVRRTATPAAEPPTDSVTMTAATVTSPLSPDSADGVDGAAPLLSSPSPLTAPVSFPTPASSAPIPDPRDKKLEPFIRAFRETQMLSHYLQSHEHDEEDY